MKHINFLLAIWQANLQAVMEYRASFITQVLGMMLNNFIYFVIWMIFFGRFNEVRGWNLNDMYITYGIIAGSFGLVSVLFGNSFMLGDVINSGRMDYYLSLPQPVLLHAVSSRMIASGVGDITYGYLSFALSGQFSWDGFLRFNLAVVLGAVVFASFLILINSAAFWAGVVSSFTNMMVNAIITFGIYPYSLFDDYAKMILFTLVPAALMGAVPAEFVSQFSWERLAELLVGALTFLGLAVYVFNLGLKRYESGSAIQVEV